MSGSTILIFGSVLIGIGAIGYVWATLSDASSPMSDGTPGSVMDAGEDVRRIDLGTHTYAAQRAVEQLTSEGYTCRLVSLEQGVFGIGLGDHQYLVYNADDEPRVREVVDELLDEVEAAELGLLNDGPEGDSEVEPRE